MLLTEVRTRPVRSLLIAIGLTVSALAVAGYLRDALNEYLMDLDVFRDAGWAFLHHTPLYTEGFFSHSGFRTVNGIASPSRIGSLAVPFDFTTPLSLPVG